MKIVLTDKAKSHINHIIDYIAEDNVNAAIKWYDTIENKINLLKTTSTMGNYSKDIKLAQLGYRVLYEGDYLIFYSINNEVIYVEGVVHGAREYARLF